MAFKVNSLFPFDKAFFGKPMRAWSNRNSGEMLNASNFKLDSIDDLNNHFDKKLFEFVGSRKLEKSPVNDTFAIKDDDIEPMSNIF